MAGLEDFYNNGRAFIGDKAALQKHQKTFIVLGVARGGTSLIAGSLYHLGIFMGSSAMPPVYEDLNLASAIEEHEDKIKSKPKGRGKGLGILSALSSSRNNNPISSDVKKIISDYDSKYDVWGFKRPSMINHIDKYHDYLRNPIYLIIFKDLFSVALRNNLSMEQDLTAGMKQALNQYNKLIKFIGNNEINACLFSYEKIMADKSEFIKSLPDIIGIEKVDDSKLINLDKFIQPNPKDYLMASRKSRAIGSVDVVNQEIISGWAKMNDSNDTVTVSLFVDGILMKKSQADIFRQDLLSKGIHNSGFAGFKFDLDEIELSEQSQVEVKVEGDSVPLKSAIFQGLNKKDGS